MSKLKSGKVAIIGCGFVGSASAFALMQSGLFTEMVLLDANHQKAEGEAEDIVHGIPFGRPMQILSLIHISEPTGKPKISYTEFRLEDRCRFMPEIMMILRMQPLL